MSHLNLNPSRDAGKFAYHLRMLREASLIIIDKITKKYRLTNLGVFVFDFSQNVEKHAIQDKGKLLVRTSRLAMEEFDRNKIEHALNREAGVPIELAHKIAEETEERLLKLGTVYLTAPLIREFVNTILVEKGLHEYRHKLTRLGLPVYDVSQLIKQSESSTEAEWIDRIMGKNVMTEYVLLNGLPREIADAHLSGQIHLSSIDSWVLRPDSIQHDLRVFFQERDTLNSISPIAVTFRPPKTFEDALTKITALMSSSSIEISSEQGISHFNVFLAPFVKSVSKNSLRDALYRFLFILNQNIANRIITNVSIGVDFSIHPYLENSNAIGLDGKAAGRYGEYLDEASKILDIILDVMIENDVHNPFLNPQLIFNIASSDLKGKDAEPLLLKAHQIAAKYGTPFFVNLIPQWQKNATYFASGSRLASDWTEDWELDTIRTGKLGTAIMNLPRLAYEAKDNENVFFNGLSNSFDIAIDSLKIRQAMIKEREDKALLKLMSQKIAGENYLRIKNALLSIGFIGLNEAVKVITGKQIYEDPNAFDFALKIIDYISHDAKERSLKSGLRIAVAQSVDNESAQRLARLDIERFGWGTVFAEGTRISPYYTDISTIPSITNIPLSERLRKEGYFHQLLAGGHLSTIELEEANPEELFRLSKDICENYSVGAYVFNKDLGYCFNCKKLFYKFAQKCPECKTENAFICYGRLSSGYLSIKSWSSAKRENLRIR